MRPAPLRFTSGSHPFLSSLGVSLRESGERHAVVQIRVTRRHANSMGGVHGGLIATLVDTVSFFPRPLLPSGRLCTTTNLQVSYLRPPKLGEDLTARAELLHLGRRTASVVVRVEDATGRLVAHGATTLLVLDGGDAGRAPPAPGRRRAAARKKPAGARRGRP